MASGFLIESGEAAEGVAEKRDEKEKGKDEEERVVVEGEAPASFFDREGDVGAVGSEGGVCVDGFLFIGVPGFGRAALKEEDGQNDVEAHLQELAFPILEDSLAERAAGEVGGQSDRGLAVLDPLLILMQPAGKGLADEEDSKEGEEDDGETVVPE